MHVIYILLTNLEKRLDNWLNIILFSCYLIGWTYILIISLSNISLLNVFHDTLEPFSNTHII
jgi:hypothetical protein